jgi:glycosyltransferase involved in cell wall biosynthesis
MRDYDHDLHTVMPTHSQDIPYEAGSDDGGRPRTLHIVENVPFPTDTRVRPECETLVRAGWDVTVISPRGPHRDRWAFEVVNGVRVFRYAPRPSAGGAADYLREYGWAVAQIRAIAQRLARDQAFDVVHAANPPDGLFVPLWPLKRRGTRFIFDQHDLVPELTMSRFDRGYLRPTHRIARALERLAYALADVVIVPNESYRSIAISRGGKRADEVFVVRNGPRKDFRKQDADPTLRRGKRHLIAYVGTIGLHDGVDHAVRALSILRSRRSDWHAIFAGGGEARRSTETLVRKEGLDPLVEFTGFIDRAAVQRLISSADVSLAPEPSTPYNEMSTMIKIMEYMALECPIVAYDLAESRYSAGSAAVYARPNDVSSFAECINELLDNPQKRIEMAARGRARVDDVLGWEHSEHHLLAAYDRALAGRVAHR